MKFYKVPLDLILLVLALAPYSDARFLAPRHASLLGSLVHEQKEMPITSHNKTAGNGYNPGSPLYKKQEEGKAKKGWKTDVTVDKEGKVKTVTESKPSGEVIDIDIRDLRNFDHQIMPGYVYQTYGADAHMRYGGWYFLNCFIWFMLVALVWVKCTSPGRTRRGYDERPNKGIGFAYGLFSLDHCFAHHSSVCFCSWCCAPLRMADTYAKEPFSLMSSFWFALIVILCLLGLGPLTFDFTTLILVCLAIYFRQKLRKQYGLESGGATWVLDAFTWICCPCCAMAQEARQVEFVKKPNDPVK